MVCELIVHLLVIVQNNFLHSFHNLNFINILNFSFTCVSYQEVGGIPQRVQYYVDSE